MSQFAPRHPTPPREKTTDAAHAHAAYAARAVNAAGEVVGVNTAIYSPSGGNVGIGFAVPSRLVKDVVGELQAHGKVERGWLGVSMQRMDPTMAQAMAVPGDEKGVLVNGVEPDSPAAEHGMQPGDVILKAGDRAVTSPKDVIEAVGKAREAKRPAIALQVERDGSRVFVALPLA